MEFWGFFIFFFWFLRTCLVVYSSTYIYIYSIHVKQLHCFIDFCERGKRRWPNFIIKAYFFFFSFSQLYNFSLFPRLKHICIIFSLMTLTSFIVHSPRTISKWNLFDQHHAFCFISRSSFYPHIFSIYDFLWKYRSIFVVQ